jgi:hypothetical protein
VARKASKKRTVHLTDRVLRDIVAAEAYSIEKFGIRIFGATGDLRGHSFSA